MTRFLMQHCQKLVASGLLCASVYSAPGHAADLKESIAVDGRTVTIGDLFTDAGDKASIVVMEAPAPGKSKTVSGADLQRIADKHQLDWDRPDYLKRVSLSRHATTIAAQEVVDMLLEMAIENGADELSQIRLFGRNSGLLVPVDTTLQDIEFDSFSLSENKDRFSAILSVPSGQDMPKKLSINGVIEEVRVIPVFSRSVMPGEIIKQADIAWINYPAKRLSSRSLLSSQQLVGMTVRRPARTDKPINRNDVMAPIAVAKGEAVTMMVRAGALVLTAAGKALENGGIGDTIRVLNSTSRQTIDAKIIRAGHVEVAGGPTLALGSR